MTPAGIEPETFRFVAQYLNHCATAVPSNVPKEETNTHMPHRVVYECGWQRVVFDRFSYVSVWTELCQWETIQSRRIESCSLRISS